MPTSATKDQLEARKLRLEIESAQYDLEQRRKIDELQIRKLEQELVALAEPAQGSRRFQLDELQKEKLKKEIESLAESVKGTRKFEPIRAWAPALSLFLSICVGTATLLYQNYRDHEFRVTQEMVKLVSQLHDKDDGTQISAAIGLGLIGTGVEPLLIKELSSRHSEEFYRAIPDALLKSVQNGNNSRTVIQSILAEIASICTEEASLSEVEKIRRAEGVLRKVLADLFIRSDHHTVALLRSDVDQAHAKVKASLKNVKDRNASADIAAILEAETR